MFVPKNRGFRRLYVYGGTGIFDSIGSFFTKLFTSNAAKQLASTALDVGKSAVKDIGKKAVDVGKNAALDAGKKLFEKGVTKALTSIQKHTSINSSHREAVINKAQSILDKYLNKGTQNINYLIDGSGLQNAITTQNLVRELNGSGLKMV